MGGVGGWGSAHPSFPLTAPVSLLCVRSTQRGGGGVHTPSAQSQGVEGGLGKVVVGGGGVCRSWESSLRTKECF